MPANCTGRSATTNLCGYELTQSLDFDIANHYASGSVNGDWRPNDSDPDMATNVGFDGLGGSRSGGFTGVFEGNGHTINNLYSRISIGSRETDSGLFRQIAFRGIIRNVGVINANVYGGRGAGNHVGGLVGWNRGGTITASYATGNADGGGGNGDSVGGLVGLNRGGTITASYATGNAKSGNGARDNVGGLVGWNQNSAIIASYATGNADGGDGARDSVGGLVGQNHSDTATAISPIIASYATGNADGGDGDEDSVGGLAGNNNSTIIASYAAGNADGGGGNQDSVGGLVGQNNLLTRSTSTITASYAIGNVDGGDGATDYVGGLVGNNNSTIIASYAAGNADGGDGATDYVGGLVGLVPTGSIITASYAFGTAVGNEQISGPSGPHSGSDKRGITSAAGLTVANAEISWNRASDNTFGVWNFGTTSQLPALRYADYDDTGTTFACSMFPMTVPGANTPLVCGTTLLGNQRL